MLAETLSTWVLVLLRLLPIVVYVLLWHFQVKISIPRGQFELFSANAIFLLAYNSIAYTVLNIIFVLCSFLVPVESYGDAVIAGIFYTYTHAAITLFASQNSFFAFLPAIVLVNGLFRYVEWKKQQQQKKSLAKRNIATFSNASKTVMESKISLWSFTL